MRSCSICFEILTASGNYILQFLWNSIYQAFKLQKYFFYYDVSSIQMQGGKQKEKGSGAVQSAEKLINVAKQMKDFLVQSYESTIDLQNRVKGAGFSYLNMDCEELEVQVKLSKAQKIIDRCLDNLRDLVPPKILAHVIDFFEDWQDIPRLLFHKKEILFSSNTSANASFLGAYFRSKDDKVFVAYKFIKSAFTLAKDVYVVHEVESSSAFFGAFQNSSKRDYLQELNRGFTRQDLALLMDMATFSIFSPENLKALQ